MHIVINTKHYKPYSHAHTHIHIMISTKHYKPYSHTRRRHTHTLNTKVKLKVRERNEKWMRSP